MDERPLKILALALSNHGYELDNFTNRIEKLASLRDKDGASQFEITLLTGSMKTDLSQDVNVHVLSSSDSVDSSIEMAISLLDTSTFDVILALEEAGKARYAENLNERLISILDLPIVLSGELIELPTLPNQSSYRFAETLDVILSPQ